MFTLLILLALLPGPQPVGVVLTTELGEIEVELDARRAPRTTANFLRYVDARMYDGGRFYRTVTTKPDNQPQNQTKIDVIQAGMAEEREKQAFAAVTLERTRDTGLRHLDGAISMARDGPDTATHEFFICVGARPSLDFGGARNPDGQGFAAFGRVVRGMDVVRKIQASAAEGQALKPVIRIISIRRAPAPTP
jgi:peptidyl-prolyl cis-trans isomerase A (cyclophilin A)